MSGEMSLTSPTSNSPHTIRQDRIDILVDLTMHMANNRLLVFARKPAPVQVTYLAYCGTTGLGAMDYRLTDPYLDPEGQDERVYSEQSIRLPETYWCYQPMAAGSAGQPAAGFADRPRHLRLSEQLLQGDGSGPGRLESPAAALPGVAAAPACARRQPPRSRAGLPEPARRRARPAERSSGPVPTAEYLRIHERSMWPSTRSPTAAAPPPAMHSGWECRW